MAGFAVGAIVQDVLAAVGCDVETACDVVAEDALFVDSIANIGCIR